ncbi:type II toxin-antitoxin system HicB family antitoxin [Polymorphospora rubra]|uniref:Type II toxin-antitoxin system HicB family antitoxin n=1 Tax=Polymorphospora rubra TaxID=338584 RepID=A0A810N149_9ACTN|nr:type II toxin-antitoxin system HicB family antitoxin [Polymorphospora rubra]BCJ65939.1 hypothetical protein Prubr_29600 [Polymorphospora rubra]
MTRFTAVCTRSGNWWAISIPEIKGVHSQARRLDQVEAMAREAIALMLNVAPDSFELEVSPQLPPKVSHALVARRAAREADLVAERATAEAVSELLADGYTVRDAGRMLGISPQRVSQIAQATAAA